MVAEIIELGRLGFLTIKRTEEKKFLHKNIDYILTRKNQDTEKLRNYQKYLWQKIFNNGDEVKLSELKNKFYQYLTEFREKVYQHLGDAKIFNDNPQTAQTKWGIIFGVLTAVMFMPVMTFVSTTANYGPVLVYIASILPGALLVKFMPARTAWGYSLMRQIEGLKWYVKVGKWREEIAEKNLFLGEILPLAIALGVVNKLAKDMAGLGVPPPNYMQGFSAVHLNSQLNHFSSYSTSTLLSTPSNTKWSGSSSWSGGSGFSGGSSGGGFGGGSSGSW